MQYLDNILKNLKYIYDGNNLENIILDNDSLSQNSLKDSFLISSTCANPQSSNGIEEKKNFKIENHTNISKKIQINLSYPFKINKNKKIFNINKVIKLGRIKKKSKRIGKHSKFKQDNIIRVFKVHLMKNIYDYINSSFEINKNPINKKINIIQKLSSNFIKSISKEDNINWLQSKLKILFSKKLSSRIICFEPNYNEKIINSIYEKGKEIKVINILDKTVKEMWKAYINNDNNNYIGFATLKDDIEKFKKIGESDEYIKKYENIAIGFEDIFINIKERKKRISKFNT